MNRIARGKKAASSSAVAREKTSRKTASPSRTSGSPAATAIAASEAPAGGERRMKKTTLTSKELSEFRAMLLEKRGQLLGDLSGMEAQSAGQYSSGNLSSMPTHMADVGTDNFEHEFTLGLLESEQALLREIDEALERIEKKTYGICLGTGEPIPKARLQAKPWAKYTVEYTRKLEKGLVHAPDRQEGAGEEPEEEEEDEEVAAEEEVEVEADAYEDREVDEE